MIHIRSLRWAVVCALLVVAPMAASAAAPAGKSAPAKVRRATSIGKAAVKSTAKSASKSASKSAAKTAPAAESASRRLEDVRIEGELEVPRVTFITVRKPHRFNDFTRPTNVRSSRRMAAETTLPAWIPPPSPPQEARKENQ